MAYFTYILRCEDDSLYTGITTDLARRFAEHSGQDGKGAKYTASRRPVLFEAAWESPDRSHASRLEYFLKKLTKQEKERLIQGEIPKDFDFLPYTRIQITENGGIIMIFVCYLNAPPARRHVPFLMPKA